MAYRSTWNRPVDAVSAVLMRNAWFAEYVLDVRHRLADGTWSPRCRRAITTSPRPRPRRLFAQTGTWLANCRTATSQQLGEQLAWCSSTARSVAALPRSRTSGAADQQSHVAAPAPPYPSDGRDVRVAARRPRRFGDLWFHDARGLLRRANPGRKRHRELADLDHANTSGTLTSLASSTRMDLATGAVTTGAHIYSGLPVVGFGAAPSGTARSSARAAPARATTAERSRSSTRAASRRPSRRRTCRA
jgi:hypothetical protein